MSEENDDYEVDDMPAAPLEKGVSRREAAGRLKVDPRTVQRWVKAGILNQTPDKRFLPSELTAFIKRSKEDPDFAAEEEETDYWQELTQALALSNQHNERLLSLIDKPLNMVLTMLTASNAQYAARVADSDKAYLEAMRLLGEQLLQKEDRTAKADREAVKTALMASAGENLMGVLPVVVSQLMAKKPSKPEGAKGHTQTESATTHARSIDAFLASLDDDDLQKLSLMKGALQGEKRVLFERALEELGVKGEASNG